MLFNLEELKGMKLLALDGEIGKCVDFLFDDRHWAVRYMDARAGNWLTGRRVLISPISLQPPNWPSSQLPVRLSREQIKDSPSLAEDEPVSREFEREFFKFYGYGYYWMGSAAWGAGVLPSELENLPGTDERDEDRRENHLRSLKEVSGYHLMFNDDKVGQLDGALVDAESWMIEYLVVDRGSLLSSELVVIPPQWLGEISWSGHSVPLLVGKSLLETAPEYGDGAPVAADEEERIRQHFDDDRSIPRG